jgi:rhodanese-related sulfurtransferase
MPARTINQLLASARHGMQRLEPPDAARAMAGGALLIDTRCAEALGRDGSIPGAAHVPLSVLYWRLDPTSPHRDPVLATPGRQVILLCADGFSSSLAAATLRQLGFSAATDVVGGFSGWRSAGLPIETA